MTYLPPDATCPPSLGQRVLQTPECFINWRPGRLTVSSRRDPVAVWSDERVRYSFEGRDAEDALIVFQVAFMRGGVNGLRDALRDIFEPRSTLARGMYHAELASWGRNGGRAGGRFVRRVEH